MTEAEWLGCANPEVMLRDALCAGVSERKLRLFACACCRRVWHRLADARSRFAVQVAERYADGEAGVRELQAVSRAAWAAWNSPAGAAACDVTDPDWSVETAWNAVRHAAWAASAGTTKASELALQAGLLRDVLGNPFRVVTLSSAWLSWRSSLVPRMAQAIYEERTFGDLPILADALEEAGCDNPTMLTHCRQAGEHVRGCWVVDLLLGKA